MRAVQGGVGSDKGVCIAADVSEGRAEGKELRVDAPNHRKDGSGAMLPANLLIILTMQRVEGSEMGRKGDRLLRVFSVLVSLLAQGHRQEPNSRKEHPQLHQRLLQGNL